MPLSLALAYTFSMLTSVGGHTLQSTGLMMRCMPTQWRLKCGRTWRALMPSCMPKATRKSLGACLLLHGCTSWYRSARCWCHLSGTTRRYISMASLSQSLSSCMWCAKPTTRRAHTQPLDVQQQFNSAVATVQVGTATIILAELWQHGRASLMDYASARSTGASQSTHVCVCAASTAQTYERERVRVHLQEQQRLGHSQQGASTQGSSHARPT